MTAPVAELRRLFGPFRGDALNLPSFDNLYPGYKVPVLRREAGELVLEMMIWGFPGPASAGQRPITNVRNLQSSFWRSALANPARRCLVPATSFCEWTAIADPQTNRKRKVWFRHRSAELFAFAGIWRPGEENPFMAFLTCKPNNIVGAVHEKAMPVMLEPSSYRRWLENDHEEACSLAVPYPDEHMRLVSPQEGGILTG
jgi:putative SOS response-associated peptidase YedK